MQDKRRKRYRDWIIYKQVEDLFKKKNENRNEMSLFWNHIIYDNSDSLIKKNNNIILYKSLYF